MCLIVYSNDHAPLTVRLIYSSSKLRTVQMMIFSLVAMIGLAKCCITSACLQWLCHSGERIVARGPLVSVYYINYNVIKYALRWMPRKDSDQPVHPHSLISLHWALLDSKDPSLFFFVVFFWCTVN